ncbi:hypothetical protein [Paenibacillus odorifer]|uniref:hypothetical protein n=1 Tax=Paenibacillus odorifer TaxID=189426 RepID=UPI00096D5096|nr:hypothetical protein [Paenibacillus odorifer]OME55144.1 hypothetical protein BSK61_13845 [Paenibacillus odorifer]
MTNPMTPERIEEITNDILNALSMADSKSVIAASKGLNDLLAALEESQQQLKMREEMLEEALNIGSRLEKRYIEAQQTIARQREVLEFYANQENWELPSFGRGQSKVTSDRGSKARELLEEGSDKA